MKLEIKWTSRRDLCYTAAHARAIDKQEIIACGPRNMTEAGYMTWEGMELLGGIGYSVWVDDNPEFSFGFTPQSILQPHLLAAWAWGTEKSPLCMLEINRWGKGGNGVPSLVDRLDVMGCTRIEARSLHNNYDAHRWLEWVGFKKDCDLPSWGKGGEKFVQYAWLRSTYRVNKHGQVEGRKTESSGSKMARKEKR